MFRHMKERKKSIWIIFGWRKFVALHGAEYFANDSAFSCIKSVLLYIMECSLTEHGD